MPVAVPVLVSVPVLEGWHVPDMHVPPEQGVPSVTFTYVHVLPEHVPGTIWQVGGEVHSVISPGQNPHPSFAGAVHIKAFLPLQAYVPVHPSAAMHVPPGDSPAGSDEHPRHALSAGNPLQTTPVVPLQAYAPAHPSDPVQVAPGAFESVLHPMHALSVVGALQLTAFLPLHT
jgi:hypothetical protein